MQKELVIAVAKRFIRGFLAGGVSAVLVFLTAGTPITEFKDFKVLIVPLCMAFLTGGLQAVDKMLRWQE